jgi:2-polyprenyl-6-hydroxyphenyl methylase/3-demethylubiquinone-9 3-methyltransferase
MAVIGCGPVPKVVSELRSRGFSVVGIEPVPEFLQSAREYLQDERSVLMGAAESLPLENDSQDVIWLEAVIEHVESPLKSLNEIFRALKPGGVLWVTTSNRQRLRFMGKNDEFSVRCLQWMPALLRESYIFEHLHYRPELASFTRRPAVHWFSFASLCSLGRLAGFAQFYSPLDLRRSQDEVLSRTVMKRLISSLGLLRLLQRNAWFRTLALTQLDAEVFMWKRGDPSDTAAAS